VRDAITIIKIHIILNELLIIIFKIIIFLKNPSIGGIPPNDIKTIKIINLSKNAIEFI
jgi:hypothetical protein